MDDWSQSALTGHRSREAKRVAMIVMESSWMIHAIPSSALWSSLQVPQLPHQHRVIENVDRALTE